MNGRRWLWLWLWLMPAVLWAGALEDRIEEVISRSPAARRAYWGIRILDAETGKTLYSRLSDHYFVPASSAKLFSTALALSRLGPEHRFLTRVTAREEPTAGGRLRGDLVLVGGGDPSLSARAFPYKKGPVEGDPLAAIEELARACVKRGLRVVEGDIVGDDTAYVWEPAPDGWTQDDAVWDYGAPVSALSVNDNAISLTIGPGARAGELARVHLNPPLEYYYIHNRIRTEAGGLARVSVERRPGSREMYLSGVVPERWPGQSFHVAVDDPALYAAALFRQLLARMGVRIMGRAVARHRRQGEAVAEAETSVELARRWSPPLAEILKVINKVSQNLHAELVLREVARACSGPPASRASGLKELEAFLTEAGIAKSDYRIEDGSGLSLMTLVTPAAMVRLLSHMYSGPHRELWISLMPVGGEDGTLARRFTGQRPGEAVRAKTGTLSHASSLSGYWETPSGVRIFAIFANNYHTRPADIRAVIDKICIAAFQ